MKQHLKWAAPLALVVAAVAAGTALAASPKHPKRGPAARVAALQHQLSALREQNGRLQATSPAGIAAHLAKAKAALDKYESVAAAEADGYVAEGPCESTPTDPAATWWGGAMGIHYVNDALLKGPIVATKPPVLTYAPTSGGLKLLAAEWFQPDADQNAQTDADRPSLFGRAFDGPMAGHAPGMPMHYDLHVWLWAHNPSGLFAPWNPSVSCSQG
jgi:hypothetical protein